MQNNEIHNNKTTYSAIPDIPENVVITTKTKTIYKEDEEEEEEQEDGRQQFQNDSARRHPPFWTEDPNILFDKAYIFEFYPSPHMSYAQKLNTVTRVVIFISVILFLYTKNVWVLVGCATTLFFVYMLYDKSKANGGEEGYLNPLQAYLAITSGSIDKNDISTVQKNDMYQESSAKNPLSNVLVTDYEIDPNRKTAPPCETNYNNVLENAKTLVQEQHPDQPDIGDKLFHSLNDNLQFEQSLRPFYSTANTIIPNDQSGFAEFCYGDMFGDKATCKEGNLFSCARNLTRYTLY